MPHFKRAKLESISCWQAFMQDSYYNTLYHELSSSGDATYTCNYEPLRNETKFRLDLNEPRPCL